MQWVGWVAYINTYVTGFAVVKVLSVVQGGRTTHLRSISTLLEINLVFTGLRIQSWWEIWVLVLYVHLSFLICPHSFSSTLQSFPSLPLRNFLGIWLDISGMLQSSLAWQKKSDPVPNLPLRSPRWNLPSDSWLPVPTGHLGAGGVFLSICTLPWRL